MFGAKTRRIRDLETRVVSLVEQRDAEIALRAAALGNSARIAEQFTATHDEGQRLEQRLARSLRACARWRAEATAQARAADRFSDQLMGAMGYSDAGLRALGVPRTAVDEREVSR